MALTSPGVTDGLIQVRLSLTAPELWSFSPASPVTLLVQVGGDRRPGTTCSHLLHRCCRLRGAQKTKNTWQTISNLPTQQTTPESIPYVATHTRVTTTQGTATRVHGTATLGSREQLTRKEQPDYTPTRRYHSIMFTYDSLGTGAFSHSSTL